MPNVVPFLVTYFADFELWTEFHLNENLDVYLIDPSKVLDIHSDVGDKNVRMGLGGERADFMKSLFRSNLCSLRLNILHMVW